MAKRVALLLQPLPLLLLLLLQRLLILVHLMPRATTPRRTDKQSKIKQSLRPRAMLMPIKRRTVIRRILVPTRVTRISQSKTRKRQRKNQNKNKNQPPTTTRPSPSYGISAPRSAPSSLNWHPSLKGSPPSATPLKPKPAVCTTSVPTQRLTSASVRCRVTSCPTEMPTRGLPPTTPASSTSGGRWFETSTASSRRSMVTCQARPEGDRRCRMIVGVDHRRATVLLLKEEEGMVVVAAAEVTIIVMEEGMAVAVVVIGGMTDPAQGTTIGTEDGRGALIVGREIVVRATMIEDMVAAAVATGVAGKA
mmetsp:Transcript_29599/g.65190  ORF Transcript_29599/g.65190 Transcript_29599/m.65190 type:complete len:307 (-) Transcript_29599:506-1426(-)